MSNVLAVTCGGSHDSASWLDLYDTTFSCRCGPYVVLLVHTDLPIRYATCLIDLDIPTTMETSGLRSPLTGAAPSVRQCSMFIL
jgi:hypothetical protein